LWGSYITSLCSSLNVREKILEHVLK
jgi:hypothetical protein